ncbi:MAG: YopX family protein [Ruminococcus sp.]|nr:YopX family protein [Ruminococcus sp.]
MREILFRGKRKDNGNWIEGSLLNFRENTYIIPHNSAHFYDDIETLALNVESFEVLPETLGEYTGLTDMNGKKIFEGDIIQEEYGSRNQKNIKKFEVYWDREYAGFYPIYDHEHPAGYSVEAQYSEVIGNIHDNPELLKGEICTKS